jgi:hypothetical protein
LTLSRAALLRMQTANIPNYFKCYFYGSLNNV